MEKGNKPEKGAAQRLYWEEKRRKEAEAAAKELQESGAVVEKVTETVESVKPEPKPEVQKEVVEPKKTQAVKEIEKQGLSIDPNKKYKFELVEKSLGKRNVVMGTTSKIFDAEAGRPREIRYIPIAPSIFSDELDPSFLELSQPFLCFSDNVLSVKGTDVRLLEYMTAHDDNEDNKNRLSKRPPMFRLLDKDLLEKKKTAAYDILDAIREKIKEKDADDLRPVARVMFGIIEEKDSALKNRLRDLTNHAKVEVAAKNAKILLDNLTNPKLERQYLVLKGFEKGLIQLKPEHSSVVWNYTGVMVCTVRNTKDQNKTAGDVAEWSLTSDEGQKFWDVFSKKVS